MSLGLIKPGLSVAGLATKRHPRTGMAVQPLYVRKDGSAVWPVLGAAPDDDDPDDPTFTGEDEDEDEDDEDKDEESKSKKKVVKKSKDDEDDDEDEDDAKFKASRQAKRYRLKLRETESALEEVRKELRQIKNKDRKPDEVVSEELTETKEKLDRVTRANNEMRLELAFFKANDIDWVDPADALRLADLDDVDVDDDGNVDRKSLRRALRELAKRKPHLVKKSEARGQDDDDDDEDDDEPSSRQTAPKMNGRRKGKEKEKTSRDELAKRFPSLRQR